LKEIVLLEGLDIFQPSLGGVTGYVLSVLPDCLPSHGVTWLRSVARGAPARSKQPLPSAREAPALLSNDLD